MNKSKYYVSPDPHTFGAQGWLRQIRERDGGGEVMKRISISIVTYYLSRCTICRAATQNYYELSDEPVQYSLIIGAHPTL